MCLLLSVGPLDKTKSWERLSHIKERSQSYPGQEASLWPNRTDFQPWARCWPRVFLEDRPAPSSPHYSLHCPLDGAPSHLCPTGPRDCPGVQRVSKALVSAEGWGQRGLGVWNPFTSGFGIQDMGWSFTAEERFLLWSPGM